MNHFKVAYWKKNKPTGTRKYIVSGMKLSYEDVLFDFTLCHLCEQNYFHDYEWFMLNEHVFVKRLRANSLICEYEVSLFDLQNRSILLEVYNVEIECLENDNSCNLFNEHYDLEEPRIKNTAKKKQPTEWLMEESPAIRKFLLMLSQYKTLKDFKKAECMSKATFYRNLRICEERGLIKNGKITRRLQVKKTGNKFK